MPRALDVGTHVPHAAVRAYVMGDARRTTTPPPTTSAAMHDDPRERRSRPARSAFSTGRTARSPRRPRRARARAPTPPRTSSPRSLERDGRGRRGGPAARAGRASGASTGGDPAGRDGGRARVDGRATASRTGRPDHVPRDGEQPRPRQLAALVRRRRTRPTRPARNLRPQVASRCFGVLLGHQSPHEPVPVPTERTAALADLPLAERVRAAARDPKCAPRSWPSAGQQPGVDDPRPHPRTSCSSTSSRSATSSTTSPRPSTASRPIAARDGLDPWEVMYDLLLGADGREFLLRPLLNYGARVLRRAARHDARPR